MSSLEQLKQDKAQLEKLLHQAEADHKTAVRAQTEQVVRLGDVLAARNNAQSSVCS